VKVLSLERNYRFAGGVNRGIQVAQGDILVLLNNDTEADANWLEALVSALEDHPEAGMAASKILLFDRRNILHSAGDFYALNGIPGNRGVWQEDHGQYDQDREVFGGCGAAVAYRRSMLDDIGLLDEDLEFNCEDVDLNLRARLAGYRCLYVPEARVYHRLSATGGGPLSSFYNGRNVIALLAKDIPRDLLQRHWWDIVRAQLHYTGESLQHFREPAARARLLGQLAGLAFIPRMVRKRPAIQAARRVSVQELEALLAPAR
jgi:GT2 family glycosyltransferase